MLVEPLGAVQDEELQHHGQRAGGQDDGPDQGVGNNRSPDPLGGDRPSLVFQHSAPLVEAPSHC
jgi:hypothetical protein